MKRTDVPKRRRGPDAPRPPYYLALCHGNLARRPSWRLRIVPANYRLRYICQRGASLSTFSRTTCSMYHVVSCLREEQHCAYNLITLTRRSQHSLECKNPHRRCFCASWPSPVTFWPQNKWVSRTHGEVYWSWLNRFLRYFCGQTDKQTDKRRWTPIPKKREQTCKTSITYTAIFTRLKLNFRLLNETDQSFKATCMYWNGNERYCPETSKSPIKPGPSRLSHLTDELYLC